LWLVLIGMYFNEAWLAPERNGPGIYVVEALKDYRYPRLYRPRRPGETSESKTKRLGWETTQATKPMMEGTFQEALQEGSHGLRSMATAREMNTYVVDERGRHGAQPGEHDDPADGGDDRGGMWRWHDGAAGYRGAPRLIEGASGHRGRERRGSSAAAGRSSSRARRARAAG
jgi:hypothetical protein